MVWRLFAGLIGKLYTKISLQMSANMENAIDRHGLQERLWIDFFYTFTRMFGHPTATDSNTGGIIDIRICVSITDLLLIISIGNCLSIFRVVIECNIIIDCFSFMENIYSANTADRRVNTKVARIVRVGGTRSYFFAYLTLCYYYLLQSVPM